MTYMTHASRIRGQDETALRAPKTLLFCKRTTTAFPNLKEKKIFSPQ